MADVTYETLIADISKAAKTITRDDMALRGLIRTEVDDIKDRLVKYHPTTKTHKIYKGQALTNVRSFLQRLTKKIPLKLNNKVEVKDTLSIIKPGNLKGIGVSDQDLARDSAIFVLHIRQPGFRKPLRTDQVIAKADIESGIDTKVFHVSQDIIDRKEISALSSHRADFIALIKGLSIKNAMFAPGLYLMPVSLIEFIDEELKKFVKERNVLIDEFEFNYEEIKERSRDQRKKHFRESDYLSFPEIRAQYKVESFVLSFSAHSALLNHNKELHEQEKAKVELLWKDTAEEVKLALRESFSGLVSHLASRLGKDESTGKPLKFNEKRIEDMQIFLNTFKARNLTDDYELQRLADQASQLLEGVDAQQVRQDEALRDSLKLAFDKIKDTADEMVTVQGRKFKLT